MTRPASDLVDAAIRARRTTKVLAKEPWPATEVLHEVEAILSVAAMAPFHKTCAKEWREALPAASVVPWRAHVVPAASCRALRERVLAKGDRSKIPEMLATADALLQWTWLPNPPREPGPHLFEPTVDNMEHIAAASAAIQNALIAATARGIPSYWSSGGILRDAWVYELLKMDPKEILLGSVFLFPKDSEGRGEIATGKLRDERGPLQGWVRTVAL